MNNRAICAALVLLAVAAPLHAQSYHTGKKITVGGEGGWDYLTVDSDAHRLYLSHGTKVEVVDLDKGTVVGTIPNTNGVHGIAIASDLGKGFTSNGRDSTITIFDLKTLATTGTVNVHGANPDAIIYEPKSGRVFTFNGRSSNASAIDARTGKFIGNVPLSGTPEFAQIDGNGSIYVNIEDKAEITHILAAALKAPHSWKLDGCEEPSGLAFDRAKGHLFSVCSNKTLTMFDLKSGKVIATAPIGEGPDGVAFDAAKQLVFSSNGASGTMTIVHVDGDKLKVVATVPTQRGARTVAIDPRTGKVYTVSADFGPTPAATKERPRPRPPVLPGTFSVITLEH